MRTNSRILIIFLAVQMVLALTMSSCKKDKMDSSFTEGIEIPTSEDPDDENNNNTIQIYSNNKVVNNVNGLVLDENNNAIVNADVTMHGYTTTTDANGLFEFYGTQVPENRTYVKVKKLGYFTGSRAFVTQANGFSTVKIMMQSSASVATLDAAIGGIATLSNGAQVQFPANAVMQANGSAYTGSFNVALKYMDPEDANFGSIMPGDLDAVNANNELVVLHSFGMLNVELTGMAGEELQVATGVKASITTPVPSSLLGSAPATIPLWYFDEDQGIWLEDGTATLQGSVYVGDVSHFTSWNCDWSGERADLEGHVYDCSGNAVAGIVVNIDGVNVITDANGYYMRWVPADPSITLNVSADAQFGGLASPVVQVGPLTPGQLVTQDLTVPCPSYISGDIVDCNNNLISGSLYLTTSTGLQIVAVTGSFSIPVPEFSSVSYLALGSNGQAGSLISITTLANGSTLNVGQVVACGNLIANQYTINGGIFSNELVTFSPTANATGNYYTSNNKTYLNISENVGVWESVGMSFPGNSIGTFNTLTSGAIFNLSHNSVGIGDSSQTPNITIIVTQYDAVGGFIKGTYSGTGQDQSGTSYTVSGGQFTVIRQQ